MDGRFVPPITIGPLVVAAIRRATHLPLDVHLMIETPEKQVAEFVRAGAGGVTVHVEASTDVAATLAAIRTAGARPGLALNPPTPLERARPFADRIDLLLVMSVNPGWGGQPFVEGSMEKLAAARRLRAESGARFVIEVDGGIKPHNAAAAVAAGADGAAPGAGQHEPAEEPHRHRSRDPLHLHLLWRPCGAARSRSGASDVPGAARGGTTGIRRWRRRTMRPAQRHVAAVGGELFLLQRLC